ncbi:long-chain-fatty-acid--CoA ligase [Thalassiella azotivora]
MVSTSSTDRPWLASYAPGVPADVEVPDAPLTRLLDDTVARHGDRVALDFLGGTTTYDELADAVSRAARTLQRLGVGAGDRVAIVLPNCPQHVVAFYAALRLGAVVVEHNPLYTAGELRRQLADHDPVVVVAWDVAAGRVVEALRGTGAAGATVLTVDLTTALPATKRLALRLPVPAARRTRAQLTAEPPPGTHPWDPLVAACEPLDPATPQPRAGDVALLQYTGGTTGSPKGAVLTHRNLAANAAQARAWVPDLREGDEVFYAVLPLFHAYGLTLCLTVAISVGATVVLLPRFDVDLVVQAAKRRPPTFLPGVPPMYARLAEVAGEGRLDLSSVRHAISGAMSLPEQVARQWEDQTGGMLVEGYGMTETSPITVGNPFSAARRHGTVGVPFPSTWIRVTDPEDPEREVAPGEPGELQVRGPQVFSGYWNRPEETAATLLDGGWIRTGDVVEVDADGFVRVVDRIKELVITGGFNVYPTEVEDVIREHPDVEDVSVLGVPGPDGGEQVVAAVVPVDGRAPDPEELRAWTRERVAGYKAPRQVHLVEDLPRSVIGKVLRRELRERLTA